MYESLWKAVAPHLSVERMKAEIEEFFGFSRWSSSDQMMGLAQLIADRMRAAGMEDVRLIHAPADGRTAFGGWVIPKASDVETASLDLVVPDEEKLADYASNPTSLMVYSMATPDGGITADLVIADSVEECEEARLSGRIVLTDCIGVEFSQAAMRAGACGIVCDGQFGHRFYKTGPAVRASNEWHNYTIPPWDDPGKGFGFSISPDAGRRLRSRIGAGETLRVHALVKARSYEGTLPVISGRLPGRGADEIALTGHFDENGADDNCSQVAVGLEVVRAIRAMIEAGEMPPLQRGIRLLFPMEVRGFNALIQDPAETRRLRFGLNIDTVGTDQNGATSTCILTDSFAALPSFAEEFVAELLGRVAEGNPLFRWRRSAAETIDNIFGEPLIGAPTPSIYHYSATHHLALDTPDWISGPMLQDMARVATTYCAFLANAGLREAIWLSQVAADTGASRMKQAQSQTMRDPANTVTMRAGLRQISALHELYRSRIASTRSLVPDRSFLPTPDYATLIAPLLIGQERLLPRQYHAQIVGGIQARLGDSCTESIDQILEMGAVFASESFLTGHIPDQTALSALVSEQAPLLPSRCVPLKTFRGFLAFEDVTPNEQAALKEMGIGPGWGAPGWLQDALMFANGKRTAGEIARLLERHSHGAPVLPVLERMFEFLAARNLVRLRPYLTRSMVKDALESAGLAPGDVVLGHFSLSRFGYIEGGAGGLIEILSDILGPDGTLMMPTFTFSWIGHAPYERQSTSSEVGAVTDHFWRRPGVLRSEHPTHSFAAAGPLASALLKGHDHTQPPLGADSPIARLAAAGGKILMFAKKEANTSMHVGESLAGLPGVDLVCLDEGNLQEVIVPQCPWHVNFGPAYEQLYGRGLVRDTPLGEGLIHTMLCQDAIDAQAAVARQTPEILAQAGCDCAYCVKLREFCGGVASSGDSSSILS